MKTAATFLICASLWGQVKLPPFTRQILPNGVVLELMPRPGVPLVGFRVLVKGGSESEPADKAGVAGVTAQLLRKGTVKRTADQFSREVDFLGGNFLASTGPMSSSTLITAEFLKKDFDHGLDLVSDAAFHPSFPADEVQKALAQRIDNAKAAKDNPQQAIGSYFDAFFFGPKHPYGRPADELSLARIGRQDIVDYHSRIYCGNNLVVIVSGDFDPALAVPKLRDAFASLPAGKPYEWAQATLSPSASPRLLLVDKPDATQTYFYIGQPGINRKSPDRVKLLLVNTLFGGRFTSMLNDALRVSSGLTYGANCVLDQSRLSARILITTYTKTETTAKAIDLALDVLKRLGDKGITAEQLASVKAYIKGQYPTQRLETSDQIAALLGDIELYGLGRGEVDDLFSAIDAVTLADANAIAKKYYKSENLTFVLLGNAAKIRDVAAKYAPKITEVSITKPGFGFFPD